MTFQKHWYLGFLGLVGIYKFPEILEFFLTDGSWWGLSTALWFLWFLYFIPETAPDISDDDS